MRVVKPRSVNCSRSANCSPSTEAPIRPATSTCYVHLLRPPATSTCYVHLLRPPATSTCNVHLHPRRPPATFEARSICCAGLNVLAAAHTTIDALITASLKWRADARRQCGTRYVLLNWSYQQRAFQQRVTSAARLSAERYLSGALPQRRVNSAAASNSASGEQCGLKHSHGNAARDPAVAERPRRWDC